MDEPIWVKDKRGFVELAGALESPLEQQNGYLTPNEQFFVCNTGATPRIDPSSYVLRIEGDGVARPLSFGYDELRGMPQRTVPAFLECAGNHRSLFEKVLGEKLDRRPERREVLWTLGGVGMAEWRGVPLRHVLELARVERDAVHVCPIGLDEGPDEPEVKCPIPLAKALDEDTLLALEMNGEPLPADHGFPVRCIVPGWVGTYSIKWVGRIVVTKKPQWVYRNTVLYVLMGEEWPAERYHPAGGAPVTEQSIKSSLALGWPARIPAGPHTIRGYARSPDSPIREVVWSADAGQHWAPARLIPPNRKYAWVQFAFDWDAKRGEHTLMTRATDESGRTQPARVPFNTAGHLFNMVHPHPIIVE